MKIILLAALTLCVRPAGAAAPPEWRVSQEVRVAAPGLAKIRLPLETLGAAQPSLADLRLLDTSGQEVPFLIDQPVPEPARDLPLDRVSAAMEDKKTVITGEVPAAMRSTGFESITLLSPTDDFLKPVSLEGSADGKRWQTLLRQTPIFKQAGDPVSSTIRFSKGSWSRLRITLDDKDTPPLRVSQVRLYAPGRPLEDLQEFEPQILEAASDGRRTEIRLQLPAEGLPIAALRFEVLETTFRRQVRLANRVFSAGEFRGTALAQGSIHRIALGSQKTEELSIPVWTAAVGRQLTLSIENGDSPPLTIRRLWMRVIPRDLIFDAPSAGVYLLCSGNPKAPARTYDVAALRGSFDRAALQKPDLRPSLPNPAYQPPQPTLSGAEEGSDIDTTPWRFRKRVLLDQETGGPTLWRIELDAQAVAHNGGRTGALRLVRDARQLPYVVDYAGVERSLAPSLEPQSGAPKGKSRWLITLPYAGMPVSRLRFTVPDALFERTMTLSEAIEDGSEGPLYRTRADIPGGFFAAIGTMLDFGTRGGLTRSSREWAPQGEPLRVLAAATWTRRPPTSPASFELVLQQEPKTGRLILETDNGDNAPIQLGSVQAYYRAPRLLFQSRPKEAPVHLLYGQAEVSAPQYDLNLIAEDLLSTPPREAHLGPEEALEATPWWGGPTASTAGKRYLFWGVMMLVVLGLLVVIAKLLPEEAQGA